jgi:2-polyprenyl-3-methyl-5-hydroxy-6-metoxy-1,4-benzoquinol methylase
MTILTVGSTNPNLSFIIVKNPETIRTSKTPFQREVRKGRMFGWYSKLDNSEFRLLFRDSDLENSFSENGEFEYLDSTRYSSPYSPIQMMNESLRNAIKGDPLDVAVGESGPFVSYAEVVTEIPDRLIRWMSKVGDCSATFNTVHGNHRKVRVEGPTVISVLNTLQMICIITTISEDSLYIPLGKEVIFKYLKALNASNASYALRHLFVSRAITNAKLLEDARKEGILDTEGMKFQFGNNQLQRLHAVKRALVSVKPSDTLFDIGCGELSHSFKLAEGYDNIVAYEADAEICRVNDLKLKKRQVENITLVNQRVDVKYLQENQGLLEGVDILLSEVMEHMDKDESVKILSAILDSNPNHVVLTVPNHAFNVNYGLEGEFRHDDHKWEPTLDQLTEFLNDVKIPQSYEATVSFLGDVVDEQPCSFIVSIQKV